MRKTKNRFLKYGSVAMGCFALLAYYLYTPSDTHIRSRIVRITSDRGMCSGEQVRAPSGQDYILTAGHCNILSSSDGAYNVVTEDGKSLKRHLVQEDPNSDLMLLEGLPGVVAQAYRGQRVKTFTHGRDLDTYSTEGC